MQPLKTKIFEGFAMVGTFVPNDGSSTMVRQRLHQCDKNTVLIHIWGVYFLSLPPRLW